MIKSFISKFVVLASLALCLNVVAKAYEDHAPLQAFIERERSQHEFKTIKNLWEDDKSFSMAQASEYVKSASFFTLNYAHLSQFMGNKERCINLVLPKEGGGTFEIALSQYSSLTGGFSVDADVNGQLVPHNYTPGLYYRGIVNGIPGSVAAFSFFNDEVYGIFSIPNVGNYVIVPNSLLSEANHNHYIMYNDADLLITQQGPGCGTDALPNIKEEIGEATGSKNVFNSCKEIKIYAHADRATYVAKSSNVTTVTNWITAIYNVISTIYRNEGIYLALHKVVVNTTADAYGSLAQGSFNFLNKFGELTQNNMQGADLAVLFSTRYSSQMGGVAWLDVLCENYSSWQNNHFGPYAFVNVNGQNPASFPTYSWNTAATAHELGHNLGSPHTHRCGFWQGGQAIDGCTAQEDGPCTYSGPQYPANGGTIMSYCHLVQGVGVNLSLGFGTQPGNLIRSTVNSSSCPVIYAPNIPVLTAGTNSNANRECTDPSGVTYYWHDGVNADTSGDRLVLKIKKFNNNIGNLDQTGFEVRSSTLTALGGGTGVNFILPNGIMSGNNVAMRRFWKITPTAQPASSEVEVFFPFTAADVSDVDGTVPGTITATNFKMYSLTASSVDPNPSAGLSGATSTNLKIYNNGSAPSSSEWKLAPVGSTQFAHFKTVTLNGGAMFVNYPYPTSLEESKTNNSIAIYPNPVKDSWTIVVPSAIKGALTLQLYAADGKVIQNEMLESGKANVINSKALPAGIYFYRVISPMETMTGTIIKE